MMEKLNQDLTKRMLSAKVLLERVQIYQCTKCPRSFLNYQSLIKHQEEHSRQRKLQQEENNNELKPYKCEECGLRFVQFSTLNTHLKVHEAFPHICHCGIGFYQVKDLATHYKLVHPTHKPKIEFTKPKIKSEFAIEPKKKLKSREKKKPRLAPKLVYPKNKSKKTKTDNKENYKFHKNIEGNYECSFCGQIYKDLHQIFAHVNSHTGKWAHVCDKCPYGCKTQANLIVHEKKHRRNFNGIWKCDICNKKFKGRHYLIIHMLIHTGEKQFACTFCTKSFTQKTAMNGHLKRHLGIYGYECDLCKKRFIDRGALVRHTRIHSGFKPYNCMVCRKAFSDPSAFNRHERTHTGEKPYSCRYCSKSFSDNSAYLVHMRRHEGIVYECEICQKSLKTRSQLLKHQSLHLTTKTYQCDYCGIKMNNKSYLLSHIRFIHMKAKSYRCGCGKMFFRKLTLDVHMKTKNECSPADVEVFQNKHSKGYHRNKKKDRIKYECDHCQAKFNHKFTLIAHIINHQTEVRCKLCQKLHISSDALKWHKCVTCRICNKYFKTATNMKTHYKQHFDKMEHVCQECSKRFIKSSELNKHCIKYHDRAFCDHCGEKFKGKSRLTNHIWNKHMLIMYCNHCMERFYTESEFRRHKISSSCVRS